MPFEWDVRISSKEHHGDRAHVQDDEPATGLHHLMGHYSMGYAWAVVCGELMQGKLRGADGALDNDMVRELFQAQVAFWFESVRTGKG